MQMSVVSSFTRSACVCDLTNWKAWN